MARTSINGLRLSTFSIAVLLMLLAGADLSCAGGGEIRLSWPFPATETATSICEGTIGECAAEVEGEEFGMESATSKRILAGRQHRYISYGALMRNFIPCSRRGASYYYCRPGHSANPYRRGCSHITRCREE